MVYRHPGAALASYRRMGWAPDLEELQPLVRAHQQVRPQQPAIPDLPRPAQVSEAEAMGRFWSALYSMALSDLTEHPGTLVISHEEIAGGGAYAAKRLFAALGLTWTSLSESELTDDPAPQQRAGDAGGRQLHNFKRPPAAVATSWRAHVTPAEVELVESITAPVLQRLDETRVMLGGPVIDEPAGRS
jgi:hypothetical protein